LGNGKVYFYHLVERPYYSLKPDIVSADHGDDISFAFGFSRMTDAYGFSIPLEAMEATLKTEDAFMQYLTNFAKTGVPFGDGLPVWSEVGEDGSFMEISANPQLKHHFQSDRMDFWIKTLPRFRDQVIRDEL
jgi:carboxylesterase type B